MRSRSRLTITLSPDLLRRLDGLVERGEARNRSHAIETLVRRSLDPAVRTAVVLAGGRQGPVVPALAPIDGQPLLARTIQHLTRFGVRSVIVLAGRHESRIRALLGGGEGLGVSIRYVAEERPRGTAGAVKLAEELLGDEPFLVIHGDVLTDIDLAAFTAFHAEEGSLATIAVKPRQAERRYGQVLLQGNRITNFFEAGRSGGISIVNTGVYLFEPGVLSLVDGARPAMLETEVFPRLARMGQLSAFLFQGMWFDIGTPADHRLAEARWRREGRIDHGRGEGPVDAGTVAIGGGIRTADGEPSGRRPGRRPKGR